MAATKSDTSDKETGVMLGFVEEADAWQLCSPQFPSKVGGGPAWLSQSDLPTLSNLTCAKCQLPTAFLLQVYAPIVGQDCSFHRTLFVFCCKTPTCHTRNNNQCFKVFRSQLSRKNDFYPYEPPLDEECEESGGDLALESRIKLCRLCGCPGQKACSRCHAVIYCSKEHQTIDWKHSHKKECCKEATITVVHTSPFLFPEFELVTEPEQFGGKDELTVDVEDSETNPTDNDLDENELEDMALHETQDSKVVQKFKQRTSVEPHQVLRYERGGSPLWVSSEHKPHEENIPKCPCGAKRFFEFQVMPQLLINLKVDSTDASIDWGTLVVYTCADSCDQGNKYVPEFIWKQDFYMDQLPV
ncbi:programmed cell death protein 2 isoform X2 [Clupea harengus]|uniref:Programmed cell death protein 2 isoform X2 n=1 Tax=Clupea harengus TaxID=7950 RepID=A0A6P3VEX2_CLUHA|nr:programmed cell death protein 2 isoform X2 [Clupea harengus]